MVLAALVGACALPGAASATPWESLGPFGGHVNAIAVDPANPAVVYAATRSGIWRSVDGGAHWSARSEGLREFWVRALAIDPTNTATVYATTSDRAYKSTDAGQTWAPVGPGADAFALAPSRPQTLYSGGMRSTDGGATWTSRLSLQVGALAVDPTAPDTVYASTPSGFLKTTDGGASWQPRPVADPWVGAILVDRAAPARVYSVSGGIERSLDGGDTWHPLPTPSGVRLYRLAQAPSRPQTLYAGGVSSSGATIVRSDDGGDTWSVASLIPGGSLVPVVAVDGSSPDTVYAGTSGRGMWKSTNAGASFTEVNAGFAAEPALDVAFAPRDANVVYTSIWFGGAFRTTDGGKTWAPLAGAVSAVGEIGVFGLAVDASGSVYIAKSIHDGGPLRRLVERSDDGGRTWTQAGGGLPANALVRNLYADPRTPGHVFANVTEQTYPTPIGGLYRTKDGGQTWQKIVHRTAPPIATAFHPATNTIAVALGRYDDVADEELLVSSDWGETWETRTYPSFPVRSLAFGATAAELHAGSAAASQVAKSSDAGRGWRVVPLDPTNWASSILTLAVDPSDASTVYAGTDRGGLWTSTDGGATWTALNPGVRQLTVNVVAFAPSGGPTAGTDEGWNGAAPAPVYAGLGGDGRGGLWRFTPSAGTTPPAPPPGTTPSPPPPPEPVARPRNVQRPKVVGRPRVRARLTCHPGLWTDTNTFKFRWLRNGRTLPAARAARYTVKRIDRGRRLQCRVTAIGPAGATSASSKALRVR